MIRGIATINENRLADGINNGATYFHRSSISEVISQESPARATCNSPAQRAGTSAPGTGKP